MKVEIPDNEQQAIDMIFFGIPGIHIQGGLFVIYQAKQSALSNETENKEDLLRHLMQ